MASLLAREISIYYTAWDEAGALEKYAAMIDFVTSSAKNEIILHTYEIMRAILRLNSITYKHADNGS